MRGPHHDILYRHALAMALEARDEAEQAGSPIPGDRDILDRIALQAERIRITTRLMEIMAWLGRPERSPVRPLGNALSCLGRSALADAALPERLRRLLLHSRLLYLHVAELALEDEAG